MTFSEFRSPVKVLFVLVAVGVALALYQLFADPPIGPISAIMRIGDVFLAFFILFGIYRRIKAAYWLVLFVGVISVTTLILKAGFAIRMEALDAEIIRLLAIYYFMPILALCMASTYGVRRHFRLIARRNEN